MKKEKKMKVFIADYHTLKLEKKYQEYLRYLNCEEKAKVNKYVKIEDKARYIMGVLLIKGLAFKNTAAEKIYIGKNFYGKPYLENNIDKFFFNISHSNNLIAIIIGEKEVGIDIEYIKPIDINLFKNILNEEEEKIINSSKNKIMKFYEIWTLKESFSKEEGIGLSILDRDFEINYQENTIKYNNKTLRFKTYDLENYKMSICSELCCDNINIDILNERKLVKLIKFIK